MRPNSNEFYQLTSTNTAPYGVFTNNSTNPPTETGSWTAR